MSDWQKIESAPKDGSEVLGFWSYLYPDDKSPTAGMDVISWQTDVFRGSEMSGWRDRDGMCADGVFTHWRPLPEPPSPTEE